MESIPYKDEENEVQDNFTNDALFQSALNREMLFHEKPIEINHAQIECWNSDLALLLQNKNQNISQISDHIFDLAILLRNHPHQRKFIQTQMLNEDFFLQLHPLLISSSSQIRLGTIFLLNELMIDPIPEVQNSAFFIFTLLSCLSGIFFEPLVSNDKKSIYSPFFQHSTTEIFKFQSISFIYSYLQKGNVDNTLIFQILDVLYDFKTDQPKTQITLIQLILFLFNKYPLIFFLNGTFTISHLFSMIMQLIMKSNRFLHSSILLIFSNSLKTLFDSFQITLDKLVPRNYYLNKTYEEIILQNDELLQQPYSTSFPPENWFLPNIYDISTKINSFSLINSENSQNNFEKQLENLFPNKFERIQNQNFIAIHWLIRSRFPIFSQQCLKVFTEKGFFYNENPTENEVYCIHNTILRFVEIREKIFGPGFYYLFLEEYGNTLSSKKDILCSLTIINTIMNYQNPMFFTFLSNYLTFEKIHTWLQYNNRNNYNYNSSNSTNLTNSNFMCMSQENSKNEEISYSQQIINILLRILNKMIRVEPFDRSLIGSGILPLIFSFSQDATFKQKSLCARLLLWGCSSFIQYQEKDQEQNPLNYFLQKKENSNHVTLLELTSQILAVEKNRKLIQLLESFFRFLQHCQTFNEILRKDIKSLIYEYEILEVLDELNYETNNEIISLYIQKIYEILQISQ